MNAESADGSNNTSDASGRSTDDMGAVVGLPAMKTLVGALNHLLRQHPSAARRLAAHQGSLIRIGLDVQASRDEYPHPHLWFRIDHAGMLEPALEGQPDVQLLIKPSVQAGVSLLTEGAAGLTPHLRVEGSVLLAGLVGELIQDLSWDYEDDLARVIGDVPARRVGEAISTGRNLLGRFLQSAGQQVNEQTAKATARSDSPVTSRSGFDAVRDALNELSDRLDALERQVGNDKKPE